MGRPGLIAAFLLFIVFCGSNYIFRLAWSLTAIIIFCVAVAVIISMVATVYGLINENKR